MGLSDPERKTCDEAIRFHLLKLIKSRAAKSIAGFWPFNGEPDITPVLRELLTKGYELALPVISKDDQNRMNFFSWRADTRMVKNSYGILEPAESDPLSLSGVDMLIMPLVAYDMHGNRLGMGAGYYDRHLEPLHHSQLPLRVGIAYSLQEIDSIDKNSWDIPLHGIVNERGWFTFVE